MERVGHGEERFRSLTLLTRPRGLRGPSESTTADARPDPAGNDPQTGPGRASAVVDSDGARPGRADRSEDRPRAGVRGRLPALLVRLPAEAQCCLLYTSPSPRDRTRS